MKLKRLLCCCSLTLLVVMPGTVFAQRGSDSNQSFDVDSTHSLINAGFEIRGSNQVKGDVVAGPFDVETPTADSCVGVEVAWGKYWISGRGRSAVVQQIHRLDLNGGYELSYDQVTTSPHWGHRDLAADEVANKLWGGNENRELVEYSYNPATGDLSYVTTRSIPGVPDVIRALARNPENGHFFTASFSSDIYEFDLFGNLHFVYANPGMSIYGAAWNERTKTLWLYGQDDNGMGNSCHFQEFELDRCNEKLTPVFCEFWGMNFPGLTNLAGGCDLYIDDRNPGKYSIVGVHQSNPDQIVSYEICYDREPGRDPILDLANRQLSLPNLSGISCPVIGERGSFEIDFDTMFGVIPPWITVNEFLAMSSITHPAAWTNIGQHRVPSRKTTPEYSLEMGVALGAFSYTVDNLFIACLDGAGAKNLRLDFKMQHDVEYSDQFDGAWVSVDGNLWYRIHEGWSSYPSRIWNSIEGVELNGGDSWIHDLDLTGEFYLMFTQRGDRRIDSGGGLWIDEIVVYDVGPELTTQGECPGTLSLRFAGITPNGSVAIVCGISTGSHTISGPVCTGVVLGIDSPIFYGLGVADSNGELELCVPVSGGLCGLAYVQGLDVWACKPTNVVPL